MNGSTGFALYNQGRFDDEAFVADFVARHETLDVIRNVLRVAARGGETEHQILIGARGMGKTSLLRRVAIAIGAEPALAAVFAPLRFREEQYNVISLDAFWRNCGEALAEWCEVNGHVEHAEALDKAIETPEWRDADKAAAAFLAACAALGRRACLLIDNLDLILDSLSDQESWSLRHVLQRPDGPIVIGAATQFLSKGADREEAFYEFFHPLVLDPLSEAELIRCMTALAERRGAAGEPVLKILQQSPERIRTLYALTGGNPRILTLIYQLLERGDTDQIFADLEALLDQVTPFYKARIEEYTSAQQRAVIDAVGLHWDPISSGALSETTGIAVTTISSLLNRLRKDGMIEQVATSGARDGYQFSERFLNIWYLMRHGTRKTRQRLKWLTKFLARLFSPEELNEMAARAQAERSAGRGSAAFCEAIDEALLEVSAVRSMGTASLIGAGKQGERRSIASPPPPLSHDAEKAHELLKQATQHFKVNQFDIVLNVLDELVHRFGESEEEGLQEQVATALFNKGVTLEMLGRFDEEIATYDVVEARFGASEVAALQEQVAMALFNKGVRLGALGRSEEAIATYDMVEARFGASEVSALQEAVAKALANKGVRLGALGRSEEAIATCDVVEARFGASEVSALQEPVAKALVNKGFRLGVLGRSEEAIVAYDAVEARFGASETAALQEPVVMALLNKGVTLGVLGRAEEAIAAYDAVEARFGASGVPELQEQVAKTLVNKGVTFDTLGRPEEAVAACDAVIARFGEMPETELQEQVVRALGLKGRMAINLGRYSLAETSLRRALGAEPDTMTSANLTWALIAQGKVAEARALRAGLADVATEGLALIDAGIELVQDNLGNAFDHLATALAVGLDEGTSAFFEDVIWLLRIGADRGHGERLIDWFEASGNHERYAPIHAALIAYVRGERFLLDVNPEVRGTAQNLFAKMAAHRQASGEKPGKRGDPRKGARRKQRG